MIKYLISTLIIVIFVPFILKQSSSVYREKTDDYSIYSPRLYAIAGVICTPMFVAFGIVMLFTWKDDEIVQLIFCEAIIVFMCSLGVYLILISKNLMLYLGKTQLEYTNFLGIKKTYKYSEILKITIHYNAAGIDNYKIHFKNGRITVGYDMVNFNKFERLIIKRLKTADNLEATPKAVSKEKQK